MTTLMTTKAVRNLLFAGLAAGTLALGGCTSQEAVFGGALTGAAVGGLATNSVGGAIIGAGIGGLAGAVLVQHQRDGWCTYRYHGRLYRDRCYR
jgi:hypothetical protein